MRKERGFTLIELMITVAIVALLAVVGYPSYRDHIARGQRSQGQQVLADLAQRQEQYLLDARRYATWAELAVGLPEGFKYQTPAVTTGANPPTFLICATPSVGSTLAARNDGTICINSQGQRWRQTDGNTQFDAASDCTWENTSCANLPH